MKNKKSILSLLLLIILAFFMASCSSVSGTGGTLEDEEDVSEVFSDDALASNFKKSVIDLPSSLTGGLASVASSGKKKKGDDEVFSPKGIFEGITFYLNFAEELKNNLTDILSELLVNQNLKNITLDEMIAIEGDEGDAKFFRLNQKNPEIPGKYRWNLEFFKNDLEKPDMILRFTFLNNRVKGHLLGHFESEEETLFALGVSPESLRYKVDVMFDGTSEDQMMKIKVTQNLSELFEFSKENWGVLSDEEKEILDLGRLSKLFFEVGFDGEEYRLSGMSHHPGWDVKDKLNGAESFWGEKRSMYMFKAKSLVGDVDGAKMFISLPEEEKTDISKVWEEDSIGNLFQNRILNDFNKNTLSAADEVDDPAVDGNFEGDVKDEKQSAFTILQWVLNGDFPIATLVEHGGVFTQADYDAAQEFWTSSDGTDNLNISDLENLNSLLSSESEDVTLELKEAIYYHMRAPEIVSSFLAGEFIISRDQLFNFVNRESEDGGFLEFRKNFNSFRYMVNPAYFDSDNGFLGTYDGEHFYEYDASEDSMIEGSKPDNFMVLDALDMENLDVFTPKEVLEEELSIK